MLPLCLMCRYKETVNDHFLKIFMPHAPILDDYDDWEDITSADLYQAPHGCPSLTHLSLKGCINVSTSFIEGTEYPSHMLCLCHLLTSCFCFCSTELVPVFKHLYSLDLSNLHQNILQNTCLQSESLRHLALSSIRGTSVSSPLCIYLDTPSLQVLSLRGTTFAHFEFKSKTAPLKRLIPPLEHLELTGMRLHEGTSWTVCQYVLELGKQCSKTLRILDLEGCVLTDAFLTQLVRACLNCAELNIANNRSLSTGAIVNCIKWSGHVLRKLNVERCDINVAEVQHACLQEMEARDCFIQLIT